MSRVSEAVLRCLFEEATDGLLIVDSAGKVLEVNPRFVELTGFERAEVLSDFTRCLLVESESPPQLVRVGGRLLLDHPVRRKDGTSFAAEIECRRLADGNSLAIVREKGEPSWAQHSDLTRLYALLSHVNQAVVRSCERQDLFQAVCAAAVEHGGFRLAWIGATDPVDGRVRPVAHAGQPADYLLGLDITQAEGELGRGPVGRALREGGVCVSDDVRTDPRLAPWREAALAQGFATIASVALKVNGQSVAALTVYERRAGFFCAEYRRLFEELGADISAALSAMEAQAEKERAVSERTRAEAEREQLRAELAHTQQLESIGRMAGVVAHDFNNMLTVILSCADACLADRRTHPQLTGFLREIREAASRSAGLARQLLTFARKQPVPGQRMDLNRVVESSLALLRRMLGERVELVWRPCAQVCPVLMDPGQLGQILSNLCVNARDAIAGTGRVTFETLHCSFDAAYCEQHPSVRSGDYVCLSVRDTGAGMDAEVQAHIFEPFFTTKCPGQGTGLGLSTVYGIVKQAGGFIHVDSAPLRGAEFKIFLPRLAPDTLLK